MAELGVSVEEVLRGMVADVANFRATVLVLRDIGYERNIALGQWRHGWRVGPRGTLKDSRLYDLWPDALRRFMELLLEAQEEKPNAEL